MSNRRNIYEIRKACDIYVSSYLFSGRLMTQIAAQIGKPILSYTKNSLKLDRLENLMPFSDEKFRTFTERKDFEETARLLIEDFVFRNQYANYTKEKLVSEEYFLESIKMLLNNSYENNLINLKNIFFDRKVFTNIILEQQNKEEYESNFYSLLNKKDLMNSLFFEFIDILTYKMKSKAL